MTRRTTQPDVASLVRLLQDGDAPTSEVVRARVSRILAFRGYGISRQDRSDLEQRILVEVWQAVKRPGFHADRFWGFVEVVAARRCIDWQRAQRSETTLDGVPEPADPGAGPLAGLLASEKSALAREVLARLPTPCRELIRLHVVADRSYREISQILGRSEAALRVQMHRCIQRAQKLLPRVMESRDGEETPAE